MAEQTLSELVMDLMNWIESLHEKSLKYQAQVETLSRDLARAQDSKKELEAQLSAYQNSEIKPTIATVPVTSITNNSTQIRPIVDTNTIHHHQQQHHQQHQLHHHHHHQTTATIYQPITGDHQNYAPQQAPPYVWTTFDSTVPNGHEATMAMQVPYYEHYGAAAFQRQ